MTIDTNTYSVPNISCEHCVDAITAEVSAIDDVESVHVDLDAKVVTVSGGDDEAIIEAIQEAGFDVASQ